MSNMTPQTTGTARRAPDCVTEVRMGNTVLTVSCYFKQDTTETAADKMAKAIVAEAALEEQDREILMAPISSSA